MVVVCLMGIIGAFLTSYTRAKAEGLGLTAKDVGSFQRAERVVLLSAPQAFLGLALNGWVLKTVVFIITIGAWITVIQRIAFVYRQTRTSDAETLKIPVERLATAASVKRSVGK